MKKKVFILFIFLLTMFGVCNVEALNIYPYIESVDGASSTSCVIGKYCAAAIGKGIRVTVIKSDGEVIKGPINIWTNDVTNLEDGAKVGIKESDLHDTSPSKFGLSLESGKDTYNYYQYFVNNINYDVVSNIWEEFDIEVFNTEYYLKIEPILILRETTKSAYHYFVGTTREVVEQWRNFEKKSTSCASRYLCGGGDKTSACGNSWCNIYADWNVIRNFLVTLHNPCLAEEEKENPFACWGDSNVENKHTLSYYISNHEKNYYNGYNTVGELMDIFEDPINGPNSGLSVGYIKLSDYFEATCSSELGRLKTKYGENSIPPTELITLYNEYKYNKTPEQNGGDFRNLLNFDKPSCDVIIPEVMANSNACLESTMTNTGKLVDGTKVNYEFNSSNLSLYEEDESNPGEGLFCSTSFQSESYLIDDDGNNISNFYGTSGQIFLKHKSLDVIEIFDNSYNPVEITSEYLADGITTKTCYSTSQLSTQTKNSMIGKFESYNILFGKNFDDDNYPEQLMEKNEMVSVDEKTVNGLFKTTITDTINYRLWDIYFKKMTGEFLGIYDENNITDPDITVSNGLFSYFSDGSVNRNSKFSSPKYLYNGEESSYVIPFAIQESNDEVTKHYFNTCLYVPKTELIKNDSPQLEFRIIDTTTPFYNRTANTNWCDGDDCNTIDEDGNLISYNNTIKTHIIDANNSYDKTGQGAKYKITLTPADIKIIRAYNKENSYDTYTMYCKSGTCENAFLYDLKNGSLNKYITNGSISEIDENFGILSNKLVVN